MRFRVRILGLESGGKPIVVMNEEDADDLGIRSLARVNIKADKKQITGIVNITTKIVNRGVIGVSEEVKNKLKLKENVEVDIDVANYPSSLQFIKNKLNGRKLTYEEILQIVKDAVDGNLSEMEIASFVTALDTKGLDIDEAASMSLAMVETGSKLNLDKKIIVDKHSVGGVPGDKTTLIVVPIVAAAGLTIPKTSSRAITGAAGTADRAEVLMPVNIDIDAMREIVEKTNGCIVWGGALHLAPADDIFIQAEYPLSIDPLLLPSIMGKKKAVGANFVVIDIPTGRGTKVKTIGDANLLAKDFIELGKKLGIRVECTITDGEQPIGYTIGPALEAREALEVIMRKRNVADLVDKSVHIAGILLEMAGKKDGYSLALDILRSGKAEDKLREIIMMQGGDREIRPDDIEIGKYGLDIAADRNGVVLWVNNTAISDVARAAGAPKDKGAGIVIYKKLNDSVSKDEKLMTIYAEKSRKLERVRKMLEEENVIGVGSKREMLIQHVKEVPVHKKTFILER
jgi:AMP phosphorylase